MHTAEIGPAPEFAPGIADYVRHITTSLSHLARPTGLTIEQRRDRFDAIGALFREPYPDGMSVRSTFIARPGREIPIRVYRPAGEAEQACILYFHGGGYVSGSIESHDVITAHLARLTGATVISVHYRRPPENPYPAPNDDCWDALCWTVEHASDLRIDPERLALAGDSAGGNLSASCAFRALRAGGPRLKAQILIYPGMCADLGTTPSYHENRHDPFLSTSSMEMYRKAYLGGALTGPEEAAPLHAADLFGMPPAYILAAEHDPVRDDGVLYGQRLLEAGVAVETRVVPGMVHGFLRARRFSPVADAEFTRLGEALKRMLG